MNNSSTETKKIKIFSHHSDDELSEQKQPIPYVMKGYIREKGLHMIFGKSGCGKGFLLLDMCESIARPEIERWHGKAINHGDVVYFCGESADGLNARIRVWKDTHDITQKGHTFEIIDEIFEFDGDDPEYELNTIVANIKSLSEHPKLVVIDPLNVYMAGDENNARDVGRFLRICRQIIQECGCAVLFVQHVGLGEDAKTRARGSSAFYAGVDTAMLLKKDGDIITLSQTKNKEGKLEPDLIFNLKQHTVADWLDDEGEPITSCTLELAKGLMDYRAAVGEQSKRKKPTESQAFGLKTFKAAAKETGWTEFENNCEIVLVDEKEWQKAFYAQSTAESKDARRMAFTRAKRSLCENAGILAIKRENDREYYCLDISSEYIDNSYRLDLQTALNARNATADPGEVFDIKE